MADRKRKFLFAIKSLYFVMYQGYIKLWRKIKDSPMYKSLRAAERDVFIQCLILANHQQNEWEFDGQIYKCEEGQFITSLNSLKQLCAKNTTTQNIRTSLKKLEKWQFLTKKSTMTGTLITIVNWGKYQHGDVITNKDINKELTKSQQRTNKELTTNKNDKNDKNDKNTNAAKVLEIFNRIQERKGAEAFTSIRGFEKNLEYWLRVYSLADIEQACHKSLKHDFYRSRLTPEMLFRQRNERGEDVDRISELLVHRPITRGVKI